jgi:hypothetical protein
MHQKIVRLREYTFWSMFLDQEAVRLSIYDDHGAEYFVIIPKYQAGMKYRELREEWAHKILTHMEAGNGPGDIQA